MTVKYTTTWEGEIATRTSRNEIEPKYTHAVWANWPAGRYKNPGWSCEAYASRLDLAQARARGLRDLGCEVAIVPVAAEVTLTKAQREYLEKHKSNPPQFDEAGRP